MQYLFLNNAAKKESKIYSLVRYVPLLSKLIENLIKDRMAEQWDKYNLIDSTSMAPVEGKRVRREKSHSFNPVEVLFCKHKMGGAGGRKGSR